MIRGMRFSYSVPALCRLLKVSVSGYYAWHQRPPSRHAQEDQRLEIEIKASHKRTRGVCGAEKIQKDMTAHGVQAGICRIKRIRKKLGIICKQKKKFKATTDSKHNHSVADNLLQQKFEVAAPGSVWISDITYIPTDEGWVYLSGHKDLFNGEIVGYAMGHRITRDLVSRSLFRAVTTKRPAKGLIHHSDVAVSVAPQIQEAGGTVRE